MANGEKRANVSRSFRPAHARASASPTVLRPFTPRRPSAPTAAGCAIVLKHAPQTPLTELRLAQIIEQAGWPAGALNVLPLSNDDAGILVSDNRLKLLSFTGSTAVGWALKQKAGKKRVVLELGGNAGVVICADANLEYAADRCVTGGYGYAGQSCISVQRILVEESAYDKFLSALVARVQKLKVGSALDESTDVGPLISEAAAGRASPWSEGGVRGGGKGGFWGPRKCAV